MKRTTLGCVLLGLAVMLNTPASAQFNSESNGSDGMLLVAPNTTKTIDLSQAAVGPWDMQSPSSGMGIYDPERWAVVFHYSVVNIQCGAVVDFINHPSGAPVVWLVAGDVTICGSVELNGDSGITSADPFQFAKGGPGGFKGGSAFSGGFSASAGFGPGGGGSDAPAEGGAYAGAYGHAHNVTLVGGSGGGGNAISDRSGGGGGGAILIASSGNITFASNGRIEANGGRGQGTSNWRSGGGSGGAVRLIANTVTGAGNVHLQAISSSGGIQGGPGRIRIEAFATPEGMNSNPFYSFSGPGPVFPPTNAPILRAVSIGGVPVPADPNAGVDFTDVIVSNGQVVIQIEAENVPAGQLVWVTILPAHGDPILAISSPLQQSGSILTAAASVNLPDVPAEILLEVDW